MGTRVSGVEVMSVFRVRVRFSSPDGAKSVETEAIVDTGSTLSKIPRSVADELGLVPYGTRRFRLGDEREIERPVAVAEVSCEGSEAPVTVAIAEEIEGPILGATALEVLGFAVDPVNEILVPTALYEFATPSA